MSQFTRRELLASILKGSCALPFGLNLVGQRAMAQSQPSANSPIRFINLVLPLSPWAIQTGTLVDHNGAYPQDHFTKIFWNQAPSHIRPYLRFFTNFSYDLINRSVNNDISAGYEWHADKGYVSLLTCQPIPNIRDRGYGNRLPGAQGVEYPRNSLDYLISQALGSPEPTTLIAYGPPEHSFPLYTEASGPYSPRDGQGNFFVHMTYRNNGTTINPLMATAANAYGGIFGVGAPDGNNPTGPSQGPITEVERVLQLIAGSEISRFISSQSILNTQESAQKIQNLENRLNAHRNYLESQRAGSNSSGSSGGSCQSQNPTWPAPPNQRTVNTVFQELDAQFDYNFEAIYHLINCDQNRTINFALGCGDAGFEQFHVPGILDSNGNPTLTDLHLAGHVDNNEAAGAPGGFSLTDSHQYRRHLYHSFNYMYQKVGVFLDRLANMPEVVAGGTGSVLDNSIVYITSSNGCATGYWGGSHSANNMAIAIAGGGRRLSNGSLLLPNLSASNSENNTFNGYYRYPRYHHEINGHLTMRGQSIEHVYNGGDKVANLQLALLRLFNPSGNQNLGNGSAYGGGRSMAPNGGADQTILTSPDAYHASFNRLG